MSKTANTSNSQQMNNIMIFFGLVMLIAAAFFVYNISQILKNASDDAKYLELIGDLRVYSQQVATNSREATSGEADAFEKLEAARSGFDKALVSLRDGSSSLPAGSIWLDSEIKNLSSVWQSVDVGAQVIYANNERILFLHEVARTLNSSIPELQQEYNNVVEALINNRAPADQVAMAQKQSWLAERIARNVDKMLQGGVKVKESADVFNLDASQFGNVLNGMLEGNPVMRMRKVQDKAARTSLKEVAQLFDFVTRSVDDIYNARADLEKVGKAADDILISSPKVMEATSELASSVSSLESRRTFTTTTALIAGGVFLFAFFMIVIQMFLNTRHRLSETAATNERNQQAILRLLDELADLADGDLTATATVSEDFTGAIADSINFTIDQLRVLVSSINDTSNAVAKAAADAQTTSLNLAEAAEHQAQEIAGASAAVNEMAVTIDQVSTNAAESTQVAERSVQIANRGAEVVQNTIHGMDTIREQIQDTSKRIKRLGESSQEIGDIVSLINDIADQTNILALNAAIQASMAGDAGRGFAVVADEVQRLAERSSAATKQIEALVKTIQSDTNEAVISMEQTTSEVVRGARLAQDAGQALEEIETVSVELAELIQNISNAAKQQSSSAAHISNTMNVIQEITSQTAAGTTATAQSIGNLADMASDLRNSVAGFKLPEGNATLSAAA